MPLIYFPVIQAHDHWMAEKTTLRISAITLLFKSLKNSSHAQQPTNASMAFAQPYNYRQVGTTSWTPSCNQVDIKDIWLILAEVPNRRGKAEIGSISLVSTTYEFERQCHLSNDCNYLHQPAIISADFPLGTSHETYPLVCLINIYPKSFPNGRNLRSQFVFLSKLIENWEACILRQILWQDVLACYHMNEFTKKLTSSSQSTSKYNICFRAFFCFILSLKHKTV